MKIQKPKQHIYKSSSKNFIVYTCNIRKTCKDSGKVDIKNKEFIITN